MLRGSIQDETCAERRTADQACGRGCQLRPTAREAGRFRSRPGRRAGHRCGRAGSGGADCGAGLGQCASGGTLSERSRRRSAAGRRRSVCFGRRRSSGGDLARQDRQDGGVINGWDRHRRRCGGGRRLRKRSGGFRDCRRRCRACGRGRHRFSYRAVAATSTTGSHRDEPDCERDHSRRCPWIRGWSCRRRCGLGRLFGCRWLQRCRLHHQF